MTVMLPECLGNNASPEWTALHLAIGLYVSGEATLGQAAQTAGLSQAEFQRELGKRRIPINYSMENLLADIETVRELSVK
jgi:predicted HTH domain antitoxin